MKTYLYNISGGNPRDLTKSVILAVLDGLTKLVPAAVLVNVFSQLFEVFATPGTTLDITKLWYQSAGLFAWLIVQQLVYIALYNQTYRSAYEISATGRLTLAEHLRHLSLGFLGKREPADLTHLLLNDYTSVETSVSHNVPQLVSGIILPTLAAIGLMFFNWQMALAMFITLPFGVLLLLVTDAWQQRLSKRQLLAKNQAANRLQEYLVGIQEIKAHNLGGEKFVRLQQSFEELKNASIKLEAVMTPIVLGSLLLIRSGLSVMIFWGSFLLLGGQLTLPTFLLFLIVGTRVFEPLIGILVNYAEMRYAAYSAERLMAILTEEPQGGDQAVNGQEPITFNNVTFGYEAEQPVINGLSFEIKPQTITALVGPSGGGKSTIIKLLARFWDVQGGTIKIGAQDIKFASPEKLLATMSMVFQDVYLFKDTIGNNIRVGKLEATQAEIEAAAKRACCHDFIRRLPQGYDTPVGEGGSTLSGGEKQRVSIARALLKDADIILLDEATSSLDPENEAAVQQGINELVANKTVITIAHSLKTIQHADTILVINEGQVVETGTHQQLLAEAGLYGNLWQLQQQSDGWRLK